MASASSSGNTAILMATRNGAEFLDEQIASLAAQGRAVDVWVSDDGSTDGTRRLLEEWQGRWRLGRFEILAGPQQGFAENFRSLVTNARIEADYYAFCDQDDIWEADKLARAQAWMADKDPALPRLFCSRTLNVTQDGAVIGLSPLFARPPSFRNALVQSLAGGNTMVMNRAARDLLAAASHGTSFVAHDWWAYLVVTGAGGEVCYSRRPLVRYRQHGANQIGANTSWRARGRRLRQLLGGQFARWSDLNLQGLEACRPLLTQDAVALYRGFATARRGGLGTRLGWIWRSGVYRQTPGGHAMLWIATLLRLI